MVAPAAFAAIASFMRTAGPAVMSSEFGKGAGFDIASSAMRNVPRLFEGGGGGGGPTSSFMSYGMPGTFGLSLAARAATAPARHGLNIFNDARDSVAGVAGEMAGNKIQGNVIANMSGQLTSITEKIANTVSGSPQDMLALGRELAVMPTRIRDWSEALKESQRAISQYSGTLASAMAESDIKQIMRDIKMANETAVSGSEQILSYDELKDALFPLERSLTIGVNETMSMMSDSVRRISSQYLPEIIGIMNLMFDIIKKMLATIEILVSIFQLALSKIPIFSGILSQISSLLRSMASKGGLPDKDMEDIQRQAISSLQAGFYSPKSKPPGP